MKFDIAQEYANVTQPEDSLYNEAVAGAQAEGQGKAADEQAVVMEAIPVPSDQLSEIKSLAAENKFEEIGKIITNLIS